MALIRFFCPQNKDLLNIIFKIFKTENSLVLKLAFLLDFISASRKASLKINQTATCKLCKIPI